MSSGGLRYNQGKTRHDLLPPYAINELARVLTKGAEKYEPRNWEKGMKWSTVLASLKRHVNAFESGEDVDAESGLSHMAHAMCNAMFLVEYSKFRTEFDDRQHSYLRTKRIGLDIDDVLADFMTHFKERFNVDHQITNWNDPVFRDNFAKIVDDENFWMSIKPKFDVEKLKITPACYVTARTIPVEWTQAWLDKHHFPKAPLYCTTDKLSILKSGGVCPVDVFVDDNLETFKKLNTNGVCCYLMDMPHNSNVDVGYKRITDLSSLA
jgi:5'(3')-deoxyribonucleotidase